MVLCDIWQLTDNILGYYVILGSASVFSVSFVLSGPAFVYLYMFPTYEKWRWKTQAAFPKPEIVAREIMLTAWGAMVAVVCPVLSIWASQHGYAKGYCGLGRFGYGYDVLQFLVIWILSDLYEWSYHYCGHKFDFFWSVHKDHHKFHNPTPFAVIADCAMDNILRAAPLFLFPLVTDTNMDILFFTYVVFFYLYGVFLHSGYELPFLSAHNKWINSAYHHCTHHSKSIKNKPLYTGFFFKIWDDLALSKLKDEECICARCEQAKGNRSLEKWEALEKPDYGVLFSASFWKKQCFPCQTDGDAKTD